jgi:hypothetical protein
LTGRSATCAWWSATSEHLGATHDRGTSPEELDQLVAVEAYEATDS